MKRSMKILGGFAVMIAYSTVSVASYLGDVHHDHDYDSDPEGYTHSDRGGVFTNDHCFVPRAPAGDDLRADIDTSDDNDPFDEQEGKLKYSMKELFAVRDELAENPNDALNEEIRKKLGEFNILKTEEGTQDVPVGGKADPTAGSRE